jgi:hypothetical protein
LFSIGQAEGKKHPATKEATFIESIRSYINNVQLARRIGPSQEAAVEN